MRSAHFHRLAHTHNLEIGATALHKYRGADAPRPTPNHSNNLFEMATQFDDDTKMCIGCCDQPASKDLLHCQTDPEVEFLVPHELCDDCFANLREANTRRATW